MANLSVPLAAPAYTFGGLLNTLNSTGLTNALQVIQDGFGRNSPLSISLNAININRTIGGAGSGLFIDGVILNSTSNQIDTVCNLASFSNFNTAVTVPIGTTLQRPVAANGEMRYNSTNNRFEGVENGTWIDFTGSVDGYAPGQPTYIQDTYQGGTYNLSIGTPENNLTGRSRCTVFGAYALQALSTGVDETAIGFQSLALNSTGRFNTSVGSYSLSVLTTGEANTSTGKDSQKNNGLGNNNCTYGFESGYTLNDNNNSVFGTSAFRTNGAGINNAIFGYQAAYSAVDVSNCSAFGNSALRANLNNTQSAFGSLAAYSNVSGNNVNAFGYEAMYSNAIGNDNSAFSTQALFSNIDGDSICAFGYQSVYSNTAGNDISAYGHLSLYSNLTSGCSAFGSSAGFANTTGIIDAFGFNALSANTTGIYNSAFSSGSLYSNTTGFENCSFGFNALGSNTIGRGNCGFGFLCLVESIDGNFNSGFGINALEGIFNGSNYNTAVGAASGSFFESGSNNSIFGAASAFVGSVVHLTNCTLLGSNASVSANNLVNATAVGYGATISQSNSVILGNGASVGIGTSTPANTLHVVGSANFQGITSGYTASGLIRNQYGTTTTLAGTATIDLPVSTVAPNQMMTKIMISAVSTDGFKAAYATTVAAAFWNGTATASSGTLPTITFTGTALFAVAAALSIFGNNLRLTVTGVASNNAVWVISTESYSSRSTTA